MPPSFLFPTPLLNFPPYFFPFPPLAVAYMVLLVAHFAGERTPASAMQLLGGALVYIHSYLSVTHPAVKAALPPTTKGPMWFFLYALIFMSMTGLLKRERHGKGE